MTDAFQGLAGQERAVEALRAALEQPVPSYLFTGPAGGGMRATAIAFAAELLAQGSQDPERIRRLVLAEQHPDLILFERFGASLSVEQARDIVRTSTTSPYECPKKIIFVEDVHLALGSAPMILKVLEEPPASTHFILTAGQVPSELATIASRCVQVEFDLISPNQLLEILVASGLDRDNASTIVTASNGSIDRATLLASDEAALERWNAWQELPRVLDGSGNSASIAVEKMTAMIDAAATPLIARHDRELEDLDERAERFGERGIGRRSLEDRHKRELRRLRTDELLMGTTALGMAVGDAIRQGVIDPNSGTESLESVTRAAKDLSRNGNEKLLLQRLFMNLKT